MQQRRWLNPSQPQTLQIAVFLLYINSAFMFLDLLTDRATALLASIYLIVNSLGVAKVLMFGIVAGQVYAANGIANERRQLGYYLAIGMAVLPFAVRFLALENPFRGTEVISLMLEVALVALLVHPMSRDYQRIWFKNP